MIRSLQVTVHLITRHGSCLFTPITLLLGDRVLIDMHDQNRLLGSVWVCHTTFRRAVASRHAQAVMDGRIRDLNSEGYGYLIESCNGLAKHRARRGGWTDGRSNVLEDIQDSYDRISI
jgi:hypothetical protein